MRLRNVWLSALGVTLAATLTACGGGETETPAASSAPAAAAGGQRIDAATAGTVTGTVTVDGPAAKNEAIRMNADPVCVREAPGEQLQETFVTGSDGKTLGNVFVYVKDGLGNYVYDPPSGSVTMDQKGCRYHPHVFAVRVGQPVQIVNSDPTLHNVHATPASNEEFNTGQPIQGMKMEHVFTEPEVMVPFKCDVHGWMNAYVAVMEHPFYAVTGPDGAFTLKGLPPGTYTVEAWHERLGTTSQSVTLAASESKPITFTFNAATASMD
ncbi:MAG: carboxypeptidase regulatory-like domain-containing protein [Vicinamibacterales bacterium]